MIDQPNRRFLSEQEYAQHLQQVLWRFWQDVEKTTPATQDGQPIAVIEFLDGRGDVVTIDPAQRPVLWRGFPTFFCCTTGERSD